MRFTKTALALSITSAVMLTGCVDKNDNSSGSDTGIQNRQLHFNDAASIEISPEKKTIGDRTDWTYVDGTGREVVMRGFNVSGQTKLYEFGYQPFQNINDARNSLEALRAQTGSNVIRYTMAWEGANPEYGVMDEEYLETMTGYIKEAVKAGQYILLDYHSDLYSRYSFEKSLLSNVTGNGAPKWATPEVFGKDMCPALVCSLITWSAHKLMDPAVGGNYKNFWYNGRVQEGNVEFKGYNQDVSLSLSAERSGFPATNRMVYGDEAYNWTLTDKGQLQTEFDGEKLCATTNMKALNIPKDIVDLLPLLSEEQFSEAMQDPDSTLGSILKPILKLAVGWVNGMFPVSMEEGTGIELRTCANEDERWYEEGSSLNPLQKDYRSQKFTIAADGTLRSAADINKCVTPDPENNRAVMQECIATTKFVEPEDTFYHQRNWETMELEPNKGYDYARYLTQKLEMTNPESGRSVENEVRYVQDGFIWQIEQVAKYLKANLTDEEFAHILGVDAMNEPFDGGMGIMHQKDFDNLVIYPVYKRVREALDNAGWEAKDVYAEPNVFWISSDPLSMLDYLGEPGMIYGGSYLNEPLGEGFVLNSHMYDQSRMGLSRTPVNNATYFDVIDMVREEGQYMETPTFLSEFGMWLDSSNMAQDVNRVVSATYQAMDSSNVHTIQSTEDGEIVKRSRQLDLYTPMMSGTQWQWDYYYDNHREVAHHHECMDDDGNLQEGGLGCSPIREKDAWNNEDFSVINSYGSGYNLSAGTVERAYPRAVQGRLLHSAYQGNIMDYGSRLMDWHTINIDGEELIDNTKFSFSAWTGRKSDAPTEIFVPRHFDINKTVVITNNGVWMDRQVDRLPTGTPNEVMFAKDYKGNDSGHIIRVWDDSADSTANRFALVIEAEEKPMSDDWYDLPETERYVMINRQKYYQNDLAEMMTKIQKQLDNGQSPVYLKGTMTDAELYSAE
ncbi:hypothetical protein ACH42_04280 [Endozoicomonas sp. (ex Bugula neritina AB1)]|nr:hypothetical protein ACH42_04280 [Endozoicomonas sp. (ex Bugula neritina AB1)]